MVGLILLSFPAMSRLTVAAVLIVFVLVAGGCNKAKNGRRNRQFRPTATIKNIMTSIVDRESDGRWMVARPSLVDRYRRREPKTDEDWSALRRSGVQLLEATNLLRIPGRLVARPGEKSENPRIELQPETIQRMIAEDPEGWSRLVDRLHDAAVPALRRSTPRRQRAVDAGEHMEHACEACHQHIGIRREAAAWKHEPGGRIDDSAPPLATCRLARAARSRVTLL